MSPLELDPRFTFDSFVIGAGNRLTCAAARRVAEAPGTSYNPLFIYSASGLGKTHLLNAIGHHATRIHPELALVYDTLEHFMDGLIASVEAGDRDAYRTRVEAVDILLLDDVQFLAGRHRAQEELIRAWDALSARGGQVVLVSDRPPPEIDGLDERLLSRFSGGLIVDIMAPDYETRVAILRRKVEERGQRLAGGVAEALARVAFGNVRELQGGLNRLLAVQELEDREVAPDEVGRLFGAAAGPGGATAAAGVVAAEPVEGEFDQFLADIAGTVGEVVGAAGSAERQIGNAILRWEGEGYRTNRLEKALAQVPPDEEVERIVRAYEADVERLREVAGEIASLEPAAPELARMDLFRDPDRRPDAEELLSRVRERARPLPAPPPDRSFDALRLGDSFALRAARAAVEEPGRRYNPFFVHGPREGRAELLGALGAELQRARPDCAVAYLPGAAFASELIQALEHNRIEAWRARYRRAGALILDGVDALADTERAQEELFHLFESLQRAGAQLVFGAERPPKALAGIAERLRTRLDSGLAVEVAASAPEAAPAAAAPADPEEAGAAAGAVEAEAAPSPAAGVAARSAGVGKDGRAPSGGIVDAWFLSREKLVRDWPLEDLIVQELD